MKKLYKSEKDKVLSGVLAGVAEYYDMDPTVIRLGYVLVTMISHLVPGIIAYFVATLVVPARPKEDKK